MTTTELRAVLRLKENMNEGEKILADTILAWELEKRLPINKEVGAAVATFIYRAYEQLRLANKGPDLETKERLANTLEIWTLPNVYHLPFVEGRDRVANALEQFSRIIAFASDSFIHMNTKRHLASEITTLTDAFEAGLAQYYLEYIEVPIATNPTLKGTIGELDVHIRSTEGKVLWSISCPQKNSSVVFELQDIDLELLKPSLSTQMTTTNLIEALSMTERVSHRLPRHPKGVRDLFKIL